MPCSWLRSPPCVTQRPKRSTTASAPKANATTPPSSAWPAAAATSSWPCSPRASPTSPSAAPAGARLPMPPDHPGLTEDEVITGGGWHPRYTRVLAIASDGDHAFALVDGNGDGAELEAEIWEWDGQTWTGAGSSGAGPLDTLGPSQTGGQIGSSYFAYGSAPGRQTITID